MYGEALACIVNFFLLAGLYPLTTNMLKHLPQRKKNLTPHPPQSQPPAKFSLPDIDELLEVRSVAVLPLLLLALNPLNQVLCPLTPLYLPLSWSPVTLIRLNRWPILITLPISNIAIVDGPLPAPWNTSFLPSTTPASPTSLASPSQLSLAGSSSSQPLNVGTSWAQCLSLHLLSRGQLPAPCFKYYTLVMPTFMFPPPELQICTAGCLFTTSTWRSCGHLTRHVQVELLISASPSFPSE